MHFHIFRSFLTFLDDIFSIFAAFVKALRLLSKELVEFCTAVAQLGDVSITRLSFEGVLAK